uniref:chitinase CLP-like n=1 Tax=Erigeron canadensis TaxID=72917 RepID=UPI001CB98172|nr:chitinase CLP-like [Erigeron canadensis]
MLFLFQVIVLALISQGHEAIAADGPTWSSVVVPVNKHTDTANPLYSVRMYINNMGYTQQKFVIDLDAPFIWHYAWPYQESCETCPVAMTCGASQCTEMRTTYSYQAPSCPPPNNASYGDRYWDCEYCPVNVIHPVTGECEQVLPMFDDKFMMNKFDGRHVLSDLYSTTVNDACAAPWIFENKFPAGVEGVMALSSSLYAFPANLHDPVKKIVALCLPSALWPPGLLFFGNGPYYLPTQSDVDVRSLLSYTPLLKQPDSFGYFIGVDHIVIKKRSLKVPANTTAKISTLDPYTTLRTDIYNSVVHRFSMVTKRIPPAKPVAPFGLCFNTSTIDPKVGIKVPSIDLALQGGKTWSISTRNSIKQVTNDVACLAFIDAGATSKNAIVVGAFQFEDNFLTFNLENSTFGFSSSLSRANISCANFFYFGP